MVDWPLNSNVIRRGSESNTFGMVRHRADGSPKPHQGWDFLAPIGTPVHAVGAGKVIAVQTGKDYGLTVVQSFMHGDTRYYAAYCHLSASKVKPGDMVTEGQLIALTGDSGNAKGMKGPDLHLHFEVRTEMTPGLGLGGRVSPAKVFGICPLHEAVKRKGII